LVLKNTQVKLIDFGWAEIQQSHYRGTLLFNAPEQLLGCTSKSSEEMWSVGCTLLELFAGVLPFTVDTEIPTAEADNKQLSLIESFCSRRFPMEMVPWVDPKKREMVYNYVRLAKSPDPNFQQIEVLIHSTKELTGLEDDTMHYSP
jgi:serine/threonine protein kinase